MPYTIFYFDEGFSDDDLFDPRSDQDSYDPDDPCSGCLKESCFGCDIADPYSRLERLNND